MNGKKLFQELDGIKDQYIQETAETLYGKGREREKRNLYNRKEIRWMAAAVLAILAVGSIFMSQLNHVSPNKSDTKTWISEGKATDKPDRSDAKEKKPDIAVGKIDSKEPKKYQVQPVLYPDQEELEELGLPEIESGYLKNLRSFYQTSFQKVLIGEKGKNQVYSPINLYFTMAMLAEMSNGESKKQIMDALGQDSTDKLREQSRNIWQHLYSTGEASHCILGNSIWSRQGVSLKQDTLQTLADQYYASTYQGEMGNSSYDRTIQKWLNQMTGGNLKNQVGKIKTTDNTTLLLLSAVDFYGTWINHIIDPEDTTEGIFVTDTKKQVTCDFMKSVSDSCYYDQENFTATSIGLSGGQSMYVFLPEKSSSVKEILQNNMDEILQISSGGKENDMEYKVTLQMPKFKINSRKDLVPTMQAMGIKDIFDQTSADLSNFLEDKDTSYIEQVEQAMQVSVDEEGCSVSSYTEAVGFDKGESPDKNKEMRCDRPFLFVISDKSGIPVFAGVVNQPNK